MNSFDRDAFEERAAIIEFDGGLSRFKAETLAAQAQGLQRWQAMKEIRDENGKRNLARGRDQRLAVGGQSGPDHLPGMQRNAKEEKGPVPERQQDAGRDRLELSPLRTQGRGVL